jgi:excisionase family DNA binding protein
MKHPIVYTPQEVANILKVPEETVFRLLRRGEMRCVRVSISGRKNIRVPAEELERYLRENLEQD